MKSELKKLKLHVGALYNDLMRYYIKALTKAEEKQIDLMQEEIQRTTHGGAPGKPEWRNQISGMLREVYKNITASYIEAGVGLPENLEGSMQSLFVRAMVILEGSGSAVGGAPIHAGPYGRSVWDENLSGKKPSTVFVPYNLPAAFNQTGNHFIENAIKRMRVVFQDILDAATDSMPIDIVARHVSVG